LIKFPGLEKLLNVMKNLATAWAVIVVAVFIAATVAWIISFKDILSIYSQVAGTIIAKQTTLGGVFISFILLALSTIIVLAIGVFTLTILLPLTIIVSIEIGKRYIGKNKRNTKMATTHNTSAMRINRIETITIHPWKTVQA